MWGDESNHIAMGMVEERLRDACSTVGAVTAQIVPRIDRQSFTTPADEPPLQSDRNPLRGDPLEQQTRQIVRQLRMWQPDVVLTEKIFPAAET